jgi:phosphoribosylaminoimidazole-succinocarboxamide synthase
LSSTTAIFETHLPKLRLRGRGKVRDIYDLDDALLIVASDRISAFDVVMPDPIPDKGRILTQLSLYWFRQMEDLIENHLLAMEVKDFPTPCQEYAEVLEGRSMLVKKAQPLPVECVVRGYLSGSGWREYQEAGETSGVKLPPGLQESSPLPAPIFTPASKAEMGTHDENITFAEVKRLLGGERAEKVREVSVRIYERARGIADAKGIIIADTKFEMGLLDGRLILIDEVLTPDSSRFWPKDQYRPGGPQPSFDKQFLRDYLLSLNWPKRPPAPQLPPAIIEKTRDKYLEALRRLTGASV